MIYYLSGKISGLSEFEYTKNFKTAYSQLFERKLIDCSKNVINPLDIKPFLGIKKWTFYMISDLTALRKCTHIAMQKNWIDSRGCHWEHYFAKFIFKLEVIYL